MNGEKEIAQTIAEDVFERITSRLMPRHEHLPDDEYGAVWLFNQRRGTYITFMELQLQYQVAEAKMKEYLDAKENNPDKLNALTRTIDSVARQMKDTELRLRAIIQATAENSVYKVVKEFYGQVDPATGTKKESGKEGVGKAAKSVR